MTFTKQKFCTFGYQKSYYLSWHMHLYYKDFHKLYREIVVIIILYDKKMKLSRIECVLVCVKLLPFMSILTKRLLHIACLPISVLKQI